LKPNFSWYPEEKLEFLYIDPIKQGLKQFFPVSEEGLEKVFIHRSNKTRIETWSIYATDIVLSGFYT